MDTKDTLVTHIHTLTYALSLCAFEVTFPMIVCEPMLALTVVAAIRVEACCVIPTESGVYALIRIWKFRYNYTKHKQYNYSHKSDRSV